LQRLDLSVDAWLATMLGWRMFALGAEVGQHKKRVTEAAQRGLHWTRNGYATAVPYFPRR
jgi:hypothetical protein